MTFWKSLALPVLFAAMAAVGLAQEARFTQRLTPAEQQETGIAKLSSDQSAVLDALVRRDQRISAVPDRAHPAPARFSLRLLPEERESAGLGLLTAGELARLDAIVDDLESNRAPPPEATTANGSWKPTVHRPAPEIHGMFSLTYGAGSGGYHEYGGSMIVSVDDPAHRLTLLLGYGMMRSNGPTWGGRCYRGYPAEDPAGPYIYPAAGP